MIERLLEYWPVGATTSQPIRVSIGEPAQDVPCDDGTVAWSCVLTIEGFPEPYSHPVCGEDSMQALIIAVTMAAPAELARLAAGGRVTFLGSEDLGFPPLPEP